MPWPHTILFTLPVCRCLFDDPINLSSLFFIHSIYCQISFSSDLWLPLSVRQGVFCVTLFLFLLGWDFLTSRCLFAPSLDSPTFILSPPHSVFPSVFHVVYPLMFGLWSLWRSSSVNRKCLNARPISIWDVFEVESCWVALLKQSRWTKTLAEYTHKKIYCEGTYMLCFYLLM